MLILTSVVLFVVLVGWVVQIEALAYVNDSLGWKKPFCTMYLSHSAFLLPWMCRLLYDISKSGFASWRGTVLRHLELLSQIASTIGGGHTIASTTVSSRRNNEAPLARLVKNLAVLTCVLTISSSTWFLAFSMTTPADLTAISNCSAFFAAALSVPILNDKLDISSVIAVCMSVIGTLVIAYGDAGDFTAQTEKGLTQSETVNGVVRAIGNLIALVSSVAFGLYGVLYKKWACPPKETGVQESTTFALATSAMLGGNTFLTLWALLVFLHFTGLEIFVFPTGAALIWLMVSVITGAVSMTGLLFLVSLTNPVFASVASL